MSPKTDHSPADPPDDSSSLSDDAGKTTSDDREVPSRPSEENQTAQEQLDDLSTNVTFQDHTNLPSTQPSIRSTQTRSYKTQENDNATNPTPPSQPLTSPTSTQPSQLRTLISFHLATGLLRRRLAFIHTLLYNNPAHLQPYLDDPPASISDRVNADRQKHARRPASNDRQWRAHAPIARRRRKSGSGSDEEEDSGEESGSAVGREGEDDGGEVVERIAGGKRGRKSRTVSATYSNWFSCLCLFCLR